MLIFSVLTKFKPTKLLKNLKELAEYDQSTKTVVSKTNQEPPQDSDIHQLIEECSIKVPEVQKQKMEDTMLELVKICQEKKFLCIHDDVDDLIESALDSKLLLINLNYQHLDKKEQEVKNVVEQPAERGNHSIQSLQNFRIVHKSSISFKDTSQISSTHSIAPIKSTKEPEHLLSMGYEHLSITPETESDEVKESNAENLLPLPSKCEVTLEDKIECDMPAKDVCSPVFTTFSNPLFKDNDDLDSSDDESLPDEDVPAEEFKIYSNPLCDEDEINSDKLDPHCFNVESDFVESLLNRDTFIDFSSKFDFSGDLAHIKPKIPKSDFDFEEEIRLIENLLYDNSFPRLPKELNAEIADTIIESIPLPIPVQDGNSQQEEIDIVTKTDDVLPPSIENFADDPERDIQSEDTVFDPGLLGHPFNINLMPVELGTFDVIIVMDWLANHHALIVCDKKIVRIPYGDEVLIVQGDRGGKGKKSKLSIISCTKTQRYIKRGCPIFLAQVAKKETEDKLEEKRLKDVLIVRDFSKVFPEDFPGLLPTRQVEF
nr:putative reverse transcriptase domain-containing protein [Tanacetum cinerariifolium]